MVIEDVLEVPCDVPVILPEFEPNPVGVGKVSQLGFPESVYELILVPDIAILTAELRGKV